MTTDSRGYPVIVLLGIMLAVMFLASLMGGCQTAGIRADDFPPGVPCVEARADAVRWYQDKWHSTPTIPPVRVVVTPEPPDGNGADTQAMGRGYLVRIWQKQYPFMASIEHEFRHCLERENHDDASEEAVR